MTDPLISLVERLEKAAEGSRELDLAICGALGIDLTYSGQASAHTGKPEYFPPVPYTTSLDAALTLVPEGFSWILSFRNIEGVMQAVAAVDYGSEGISEVPALALVIAALRARQQGEGQ